jgi:hypothetical protein
MKYDETIIRNYFDSININLIDIISISENKIIDLDIDVICVNMNRLNRNEILIEDELYMNKKIYMNELILLRCKKLESI